MTREFDVRLYVEPGRTFPPDAFQEKLHRNTTFLGYRAYVKDVQVEEEGQSVLFILTIPKER